MPLSISGGITVGKGSKHQPLVTCHTASSYGRSYRKLPFYTRLTTTGIGVLAMAMGTSVLQVQVWTYVFCCTVI